MAITLLWIFYTRIIRAHLHLEISHKCINTYSLRITFSMR